MKKYLLLALTALLVLTSFTQDKVTTIFIIGDSTAAKKDLSKGSPERGWGMALQQYFDEAYIKVDNHAVNGRSSKSFIDEGRWDKVLALIKPGDYVIIQFGHNDEKAQPERHTDPGSTFDYNLSRYIRETRERGGIPIVMNPVVRRNWGASPNTASPDPSERRGEPIGSRIDDEALRNTTATDAPLLSEGSGEVLIDTHGLYAVAPRDVAQRMNCLFVDANKITHDLEQQLGVEGSKKLHMWYKPGEHPALPDGRQDNTHYNEYGAKVVAGLLADALCEEIPLLKKYRKD
jgi:pectinesterase